MSIEIDPWGGFPAINTEVPTTLEGYQAEVLAGKTYITAEMFAAVGYTVEYIETGSWLGDQLKAAELAEHGLPCYLKLDDAWEYSLKTPQELEAAIAELSTENLESAAKEQYWNKFPNRLKGVDEMLKTPEIEWLVQDKVHSTGLFQLYGASYAGKTLITIDLVMSWCAGLDNWQGYHLNNGGEPQEALYIAAEGGAAVSVHVDAWIKYHRVDKARLAGLKFLDGGDGDHVFLSVGKKAEAVPENDSWDRLFKEVVEAGINPSLVVFDTQIDIAPGVDENSNTDMVGILREIKRKADSAGFMAMVIHHTGHDGSRERGASGMKGKCDAQARLEVIGKDTGQAKLTWTKVKGRECPKDIISYHIQGSRLLPDLDSEGAVCVPISNLDASKTYTTSEHQLAKQMTNALSIKGKLSAVKLSEEIGVGRNTVKFKEMIDALLTSKQITITGKGPTLAYELAPNFHDDTLS
ncbi:AAA family ATPase [Arthrobacter sp. U41]|uniref:AAA family ATPase n=1 Tax=Arthrobacter sp. U41 TaxID=1849032 RepID=UPI00085960FA|nr:AAA family ATPase [Arthrobacter sp. U41]AOT04950.1 hypothetical protein ASPU41_18135 [Arthrobacter sp. U41]